MLRRDYKISINQSKPTHKYRGGKAKTPRKNKLRPYWRWLWVPPCSTRRCQPWFHRVTSFSFISLTFGMKYQELGVSIPLLVLFCFRRKISPEKVPIVPQQKGVKSQTDFRERSTAEKTRFTSCQFRGSDLRTKNLNFRDREHDGLKVIGTIFPALASKIQNGFLQSFRSNVPYFMHGYLSYFYSDRGAQPCVGSHLNK